MNLATIKQLAEDHNNHELQQAEADLLEGRPTTITIHGENEGEQLTHVLAALWIVQHVKENGTTITEAAREYTKRVRKSIS